MLAILLSLAVSAQPALNPNVDAIFKAFARPDSPGCAVGVYRDGAAIYARAYGMANLDHDVPLTPRSVFHVASISKQFTAAAIQVLARDGKLSLDDDIRKHLPELADFGKPITIRHLIHHTSGIRDQWRDEPDDDRGGSGEVERELREAGRGGRHVPVGHT